MDHPLQILLIDDDDVDRMSIRRALARSSLLFCIHECKTAEEGLAAAARHRFDVILLDYCLPDRNGLDVIRELRSGRPLGAAIIMISHQDDDELADRCIEGGAQDFLLKSDVNGRRLRRAMNHARQRNQIEGALKKGMEQLHALSITDALTGLLNRRGLELATESAVSGAQRDGGRVALLVLDLDHFKQINDTDGHKAGDAVLVQVAERLRLRTRAGDSLGRLGGDEFVVLVRESEAGAEARRVAQRIHESFQVPLAAAGREYRVSVSIGIADLEQCDATATDLLRCADLALYRAKQEGRNLWRTYSPEMRLSFSREMDLQQQMKAALARGEFRLYYQTQVRAGNLRLGGVEALLRWLHPQHGLLTPDRFLHIAESAGFMVPLGEWVAGEACRQYREWQQRYPGAFQDISLGINVSPVQLCHGGFVEALQGTLKEHSVDPRAIELEITENTLIDDSARTVAALRRLAECGVRISLDDFGTGFSSLHHVRLFPIDVVKIDKAFVNTVDSNARDARLLEAILAFARHLDLKVVAEGVETLAQADFCHGHGCHLLQGFFYSHPMPAANLEELLCRVPQTATPALIAPDFHI